MPGDQNQEKIEFFEYSIYLFSEWYSKVTNTAFDYKNNDFSKLKCIKLHFFLCSTSVDNFSSYFEFYALPLGPVDITILNAINSDSLRIFKITDRNLTLKDHATKINDSTFSIDEDIKTKAQDALKELIKLNSKLVTCSAIELVEISHKWTSWDRAFNSAINENKRKYKIENRDIANEPIKYYGN